MFREKIRGVIRENNVSLDIISRQTKINKSALSSYLAGNRTLPIKHVETLMDYLNLTLVPKKNFTFDPESLTGKAE